MTTQQLLEKMLHSTSPLHLDMQRGIINIWEGAYYIVLEDYAIPGMAATILVELTTKRFISDEMLRAIPIIAETYFMHRYGRSAAALWREGAPHREAPKTKEQPPPTLFDAAERSVHRRRVVRRNNDKFEKMREVIKDYGIFLN